MDEDVKMVEEPKSTVRRVLEETTNLDDATLAAVATAIEDALEEDAEAGASHLPPLKKLVQLGILRGYDEGLVDGVAFATVGPDDRVSFQFWCPARQNVMAGAIAQLAFVFAMARHMDMLTQQQATQPMVKPGRA